jgi:hypothetical protein
MIYAELPSHGADMGFEAESYSRKPQLEWVCSTRPSAEHEVLWELDERFLELEGGNLLLRLSEKPKLRLNHTTKQCEVVGWEMARRFLDLFSKAEDEALSESEAAAWIAILEKVDYTAFSIDRSAPHYVEGRVLRSSPHCRVEWHDGSTQPLPAEAARALCLLNPGESFGAFVKFGRDNEVKAIERVSKLIDS